MRESAPAAAACTRHPPTCACRRGRERIVCTGHGASGRVGMQFHVPSSSVLRVGFVTGFDVVYSSSHALALRHKARMENFGTARESCARVITLTARAAWAARSGGSPAARALSSMTSAAHD